MPTLATGRFHISDRITHAVAYQVAELTARPRRVGELAHEARQEVVQSWHDASTDLAAPRDGSHESCQLEDRGLIERRQTM